VQTLRPPRRQVTADRSAGSGKGARHRLVARAAGEQLSGFSEIALDQPGLNI
jgi:hypothetical protein